MRIAGVAGRKQAPHARARDPRLPRHSTPATYAAMAGSPLKRQRKLGIGREDGSVIPFPYMPRVADLPAGWRHFSAAQKIEHLIGLDRCYEILSWGPIIELDPVRRSVQWQVMRVLLQSASRRCRGARRTRGWRPCCGFTAVARAHLGARISGRPQRRRSWPRNRGNLANVCLTLGIWIVSV